jgi:type IV secretory pathway protease TraF
MPGGVLLIKRVAAVGGDAVCSDGRGLVSPGGVHPVRSRDRQGQPLSPWSGCRRLGPGELFLLGDTAGSFDSRYFGPVSRDEVRGVYREVMTW